MTDKKKDVTFDEPLIMLETALVETINSTIKKAAAANKYLTTAHIVAVLEVLKLKLLLSAEEKNDCD